MSFKFPKHFLFGASIAGHQVDGDNTASNWWHAEQSGKIPASGKASDHYHLFDKDFAMAQQLGL
ncbi:MAG: family 1 glycosylhydrolase, partial [bacterium]|nr:family 1 glycosylhydrolase [bacterium]